MKTQMKTERGFYKFNNGHILLYILDGDLKKFSKALITEDINEVCDTACLEFNKDGLLEKTRWPNSVQNEFDLINHVKLAAKAKNDKNS